MGNAESTKCSIAVRTEKVSYMAGDTVKGDVYLMVQSPITANGLFLRVKGSERTYFTERRHRDNDILQSTSHHLQDRERTYQDEVSFFNVSQPLMTAQNGQLAPGQYQVPFSFTLPHTLPGVFAEEEGFNGSDNYRCSIDYEVMAYVEVPGVFSANIKHRQLLAVSAATDLKAIRAESVEKVKKVCFLCCIPRGEIWVRASMDRNAYKPGETANISLEMNNGSKAAIHHVTVQLLRRLRLGTRGNGWGFYKTDLLNSVELPGLQPGESRMDFAGRTLAFPLVALPGPEGEPPVSLQAEVKGDIIECEYVIEVVAKVDWTPTIGVEIPVHIYHTAAAPPPGFVHAELPTAQAVNWNPQIADPVDVPLPVASIVPSAPSFRNEPVTMAPIKS